MESLLAPLVPGDQRHGAFPVLAAAIGYLLHRVQTDPEVCYRIGPGCEAHRLLCLAEAAATGLPLELVERQRYRDLVPDHHLRPLELDKAHRRIALLEEHVSNRDAAEIERQLEEWETAEVERIRAARARRGGA